MANSLRFHPATDDDLRKAVRWYDNASAQRGQKFRQAVSKRFSEILRAPSSFAMEDNGRFAKVPGFPYLIVFLDLSPTVYVIGIVHSASDPDVWKSRIESR